MRAGLFSLLCLAMIGAIIVIFRAALAKKRTVPAAAAAALPALVTLGLYYSLAIHMHHSLGGWPASIGERGFPEGLLAHANLTQAWFLLVCAASFFCWPVCFFLSAIVPRGEGFVYYLLVYGLSCFLCFVGMMLAPDRFLNWWWD